MYVQKSLGKSGSATFRPGSRVYPRLLGFNLFPTHTDCFMNYNRICNGLLSSVGTPPLLVH